ncbi:MAG: hypothetical protein ACREBQ_12160 [Nitrososphaerales archaeon]
MVALKGYLAESGSQDDARSHGGAPTQNYRAMENLKFALRLRFSQGPLGVEQVAKIANLLDEAAKSVEGS